METINVQQTFYNIGSKSESCFSYNLKHENEQKLANIDREPLIFLIVLGVLHTPFSFWPSIFILIFRYLLHFVILQSLCFLFLSLYFVLLKPSHTVSPTHLTTSSQSFSPSYIFPIFLCALNHLFLFLHKLLILDNRFLCFFSLHNFCVGLAKQGCHFLKTFFVACLQSEIKTKEFTFASVSLSINSLLSSACSWYLVRRSRKSLRSV